MTNPFEAFSTSSNGLAHLSKEAYDEQLTHAHPTPLLQALSRLDQKRAAKLASQLDIRNYEAVLTFGHEVQNDLKSFSNRLLTHVQRKDTSKIGDILYELMDQLDQINPDALLEKKQGLLGKIFGRQHTSLQQTMSQYNRLSKYIDRLSIQLQHAQEGLLSDYALLNELYALNEDYFNDINVFIAAGELKKKELQETLIPALEMKLKASINPMDEQELKDMQMRMEWIDRRLYDLEISREIAIQSAPQIRMIQQTHQMLIEKVQTSVLTTIPLWQSQISMLLSMNQQRRAADAQRRLLDASEEMMSKSAKTAHVASRQTTGGLSEDDVQNFKETQLRLLQDLEETLRIQAIANEKRKHTESDLI